MTKITNVQKTQLDQLIKRKIELVKLHNEIAHELNILQTSIWGTSYNDEEIDEIIDALDCGFCDMDVEEFIDIMDDYLNSAGL